MAEATPELQSSGASDEVTEIALTDLSQVLVELGDHPDNVPLIRRQIQLMFRLSMTAEILDAYDRLSSLVMLDEATWLSYFDLKIPSCQQPLSLDAFVEILEKYDQAEQDYISAAVLTRHIQFVLSCFHAGGPEDVANSTTTMVDSDVTEFLSEDTTRNMIKALYQRGEGLLDQSEEIWQIWLQWELGLLQNASIKQTQMEVIHTMFADRVKIPHTNIDQTTSAYSNFCSQYCPEEYEVRMVESTESSRAAKMKLSEKRYGKTRSDFEEQLAHTTELNAQIAVLLEYASWESDPRARNNARGKGPQPDHELTQSVYERAVSRYSLASGQSQAALDAAEESLRHYRHQCKGQGRKKRDEEGSDEMAAIYQQIQVAGQAIRAYKDAEAAIWAKYGGWAAETLPKDSAGRLWIRATRACPQNGDTWINALLSECIFEKSLALGLLTVPEGRTSDLVTVFVGKAAYENRLASPEDIESSSHPVLSTVLRGMDLVTQVNKSGDTTLKLEKFLLSWAEHRAPAYIEQALAVIEKPSKARSSSYQMVLLHTDILSRRGQLDLARSSFFKAIQRSDLDWPEAVYDALIQFEHVHGTLDSLLDARTKIEREQEKLSKRREKAALETQQYIMSTDDAVATVQPILQSTVAVEATNAADTAKEPEGHQKRDREHTTILLSGLPKGTTRDRINSLFSDCGDIRETTILTDDESMFDAALVEFTDVEAVPHALQKDRRKIDDAVISVSMLWRSTLFVTNFAPEMDDAALRQLFGQYGRILQTRWPSRKYASNRRFCYITMETPAAAQEALLLHGYKASPEGFGMNVLISDPSAKTQRSDASNSTLFVGGLNDKTTESDVRGLLKDCGTIRHLKLGWDSVKKVCRGFAFVEMASEAEANACLSLDGTPYQRKILKVQISDPNYANKKAKDRKPDQAAERRDRLVTLSGLPDKTQEGLLQQWLEKIVPVRRLELFAKTQEAVAELESSQDVGKLLLRSEPLLFEGKEVHFSTQRNRSTGVSTVPAAVPTSSTSFAPRATRKAKVIAKSRPTAVAAAASTVAAAKDGSGVAAQGQSDFRALVAAKNKQREDNLANAKQNIGGEKRKSEHDDNDDAKRTRT
nr:uncharacterized protein I203_07372 [Kwoniella mangroviensis CBS 8507]OCF63674.1 hypothetical protein I203_07372 [Kwoniella mangroviensis CBS 8507]